MLGRAPLPCLIPLYCRPWAIAGRDRGKLEKLAASLEASPAPGIVVADVRDEASLRQMAE